MKGEYGLVSVPSGNGEVTNLLPAPQPVLQGGGLVAAGMGQVDWQGLRTNAICGRAKGATKSRLGIESQEETPGSLTTHQGRDSGRERMSQAQCSVCSFLSCDVVGTEKPCKASGGCGEGAAPLTQQEKE